MNFFSPSRSLVFPALLALASGAAALGHQLLWTRRLVDLLGAHAESVARVFGCFFLGLALGAALAAWLAPRCRRPWRLLATAEAGILLLAIPILLLPRWSDGIWPALGPDALAGWPGAVIKTLLSITLVTPPALLMGFFLPLLGRAVLHQGRSLGREGVSLYAFNTLGGVIGLTTVAAWGLSSLGAFGSMVGVMLLNLGVTLACLAADVFRINPAPVPVETTTTNPGRPHGKWLALAFLSGFGVLAAEVIVLKLFMLVAPLSFQAPAALLILVILMLTLGAFLIPPILRRTPRVDDLLHAALALTSFAFLISATTYLLIAKSLAPTAPVSGLPEFLFRLILFGLLAVGPAFLVAGTLFPICCAAADPGGESGKTSRAWGWLLAVNGLGGLVGAEIAWRILLPTFGPYTALGLVAMMYGLAALTLVEKPLWLLRTTWAANAVGVVVVALFLPGLPLVNPHLPVTIHHQQTSREGSIAVVESERLGRGILVANQYLLGSTADRWHQERMGHLPLLLHPNPHDTGFIALATGITASAALDHQAVERSKVVELSSSVNAAARDWFADYNRNLHHSPKIEIVIDDGRTWVAAHRKAFDVLIGDLYLPWGPGEARLYTKEHFAACLEALKEGGLFCQWLPMHQLTENQLAGILAGFIAIFGEAYLITSTFESHAPSLGVIGFRNGNLERSVMETRIEEERLRLRDPVLRSAPALETLILGSIGPETGRHGRVQTLDNVWIELDAGSRRVIGEPGIYLAGPDWPAHAEALAEAEWENGAIGRKLREWHALPRDDGPMDDALKTWLEELQWNDLDADWSRWPGRLP